MPRPRSLAALAAFVLLPSLAACYPNTADVATGEMILGLSDELNDLRDENAILQEQIDSLYAITSRQDTLIRRLASHTGFYIPQ